MKNNLLQEYSKHSNLVDEDFAEPASYPEYLAESVRDVLPSLPARTVRLSKKYNFVIRHQ